MRYPTEGSSAVQSRESTARPLKRSEGLPEEPLHHSPVRRVKTRLHISPFALLGSAAAMVMLFLVIFSYMRLYEAQSTVSGLKQEITELEQQRERLSARFENALNLEEVEARARKLGLREPLPSQIVYVEVAAGDTTEVFQAPEEGNIFRRVYEAIAGTISDAVEYFS